MRFIISKYQVKTILDSYSKGLNEISISLNLGKTEGNIKFTGDNVLFPDGQYIPIKEIRKILNTDSCVLVGNNNLLKVQFYSPETRKTYKLVATGEKTPPTLSISGIRMHRVKDVNPLEDTISKIESISPIKGRVLDTCMGLGYTAIMASKNSDEVITVENDPNVIEIARINPWSEELWGSDRIRLINGNISEEIKKFRAGYFGRITHDPPRFSLAGELYSAEFYRELFRVLKNNGKIYHYTGNPGERYRGKNFVSGIVKRLSSAGFRDIKRYEKGLGVIAKK